MPIYEYQCAKCSHEFEREQRMADPPVKTCPECKGRKVTKLISRSSFVLKGGGWYADGYSDAKKPEKPDKSADGDKTKDSSSSSPDAKTEKASSSGDSGGKKKKAKESGKKTAD